MATLGTQEMELFKSRSPKLFLVGQLFLKEAKSNLFAV